MKKRGFWTQKSFENPKLFFPGDLKKKLTGGAYGSYFAGGLPAETENNTPKNKNDLYDRVTY